METPVMLEVKILKRVTGFNIDISFSCPGGRLLALIGPSGAGKTTVLRVIAGLVRPDQGSVICGEYIWCDTKKKIWLSPQRRRIGYVFQDYTLLPHLNVERNIAFAGAGRDEVEGLLKLLDIEHLKKRRPHEISGGERQRAALAQALARKPRVLLLDEPFSALDVAIRQRLREELKRIKKLLSVPVILVTHDLMEAHFLADEIVPIRQGKRDLEWPRKAGAGQGEAPEAICRIAFEAWMSGSRYGLLH
jgi:molybdate transport system ATP-binding protein